VIQSTDIEQMSVEERLQAMELLWDSITRTPKAVPSPPWHEEVLASRLAKIERGEGEFLTVAQLKERLQKPTT
jgi:putative addiction module component (TIGR02574 family)